MLEPQGGNSIGKRKRGLKEKEQKGRSRHGFLDERKHTQPEEVQEGEEKGMGKGKDG